MLNRQAHQKYGQYLLVPSYLEQFLILQKLTCLCPDHLWKQVQMGWQLNMSARPESLFIWCGRPRVSQPRAPWWKPRSSVSHLLRYQPDQDEGDQKCSPLWFAHLDREWPPSLPKSWACNLEVDMWTGHFQRKVMKLNWFSTRNTLSKVMNLIRSV